MVRQGQARTGPRASAEVDNEPCNATLLNGTDVAGPTGNATEFSATGKRSSYSVD